MPETTQTILRIAVAQSTVREDPTDADGLRASGAEARRFLQDAAAAGARLVHFPEGALCFPNKYVMSELGPDELGPADWTKASWSVLQDELDQIVALSGELGIWTVIASVHQRPDGKRPHNSLYVVSDQGKIVARYDERTLSTTKLTYMYTPDSEPVTFEIDGYRLGLTLGMDVHFPELYTAYDAAGVDGVLISYSTKGGPGNDRAGTEARGHAAANCYWVSLAVAANPSSNIESGVIDSMGDWIARCPSDGSPAIAVADLDRSHAFPPVAHDWRREARSRISS
ncbi:carbon-nitrogen hydrolase family protein [Kribbella sp. NPDC006257]|uniref:carbon-nitrogen hydrolase family protein n=1 Tax=Kribbella sp. NPDC006257 TaxID=3156738 RepID=UPI0033B9C239